MWDYGPGEAAKQMPPVLSGYYSTGGASASGLALMSSGQPRIKKWPADDADCAN